jgi:hypothetical protein
VALLHYQNLGVGRPDIHANTSTTAVRAAVARFEGIPLMPILAR